VDRAAGIPCCRTTRGRDTTPQQNRSARNWCGSDGRGRACLMRASRDRRPWTRAGPGVAGGVGWLRPPMRAGETHASFHVSLGDVLAGARGCTASAGDLGPVQGMGCADARQDIGRAASWPGCAACRPVGNPETVQVRATQPLSGRLSRGSMTSSGAAGRKVAMIALLTPGARCVTLDRSKTPAENPPRRR
jgi:hypothetical protein